MIIGLVGLILFLGLGNMVFYEYRVRKDPGTLKELSLIGWKR